MAESKTPSKNAEHLITGHLDIWTTAIEQKSSSGRGSSKKFSLHGIKKLRELILELAVRGKLVPQDPNDEPASVLLERIAAEKAQLVKDKKIKKPKALPEVSEDEKPFEVPEGWEWTKFGCLSEVQSGFAFKSREFNESGMGLPLIRIRDVGQPSSGTFYSGEFRDEFLVSKGDYLISMDGNFRVAAWSSKPALLNQRVSRLQFYVKGLGEAFLAQALQLKLLHLQGVKAYTTVDHLSAGQIKNCVIGFPPLREQHRIVAKVDELMSLCDALEAQTENSITAHQTLVEVLLEALLKTPEEGATLEQSTAQFQQNWQRLSEHFDTLFTTTASIDTLKHTILQLAVMGKLVPQNPSDEPAAKLLERIAAEKAQLIKDKKIKKQKPLPEITDEEKPFELPEGWEWCRGESVADFIDPQPSHRTPPKVEGGVPYIGYTDIDHSKGINFDGARKVGSNVYEEHLNRYTLKLGDFVFGKIGTLGKPYFLEEPFNYCLSANLILIQPNLDLITAKFLALYLNSPALYKVLGEQKTNSTHGVFGIKKARLLLIPYPPFEEQHRIVAKVDELMTLCDQLKARLTDAQTTKLHLTNAIVEQAVN